MEGESIQSDSSLETASTSADVPVSSGSLRLLLHLKDNQVQYLLGLLVLHQIGVLEKVYTHASGVCF